MGCLKIDEKFDEVVRKDIKKSIAEAFIDLKGNIEKGERLGGKSEITNLSRGMAKEKAKQMKTEINDFIDSLVESLFG